MPTLLLPTPHTVLVDPVPLALLPLALLPLALHSIVPSVLYMPPELSDPLAALPGL